MTYRVGIVGVTGAVGQECLSLLQERSFPLSQLRVFASERSAGLEIEFGEEKLTVETLDAGVFEGLDLALFCATGEIARELAPEAIKRGCVVVDNSSAFRQEEDVPLVVPEINAHALESHRGLIANPNCSTAIALMGLYPLHEQFGLVRFFASTYQAVSGSGLGGIRELEQQVLASVEGKAPVIETYPHPIAFNVLPHVDRFMDNGYTREELKMLNESRKIMELPELRVSCTCVRVPVMRTHSISIHAEFEKPVDVRRAKAAIRDARGVMLEDEPSDFVYPMPLTATGRGDCSVGRIRRDEAFDNGLALWVAGDQLLKGAALNAVQIAESLDRQDLLRIPVS